MNQVKPAKVNLRQRKLYSGDYSYFVDYYEPGTGKRVRRSVGQNKKKAELMRSKIEWKLFKGDKGDIPKAVMDGDIESFFNRFVEHCANVQSKSTFIKDRCRRNSILKFIEDNNIQSLDQITPGLIQRLESEYLDDHARKSWKNLLVSFKSMLNRAVEWGVIDYNPITSVKAPQVTRSFHYFTKEEVDSIIKSANEPLKTAIIILVNTGLRRSELFHLRWRDIKFDQNILLIEPHDDFITKSGRARSIPISGPLRKHLKKLKRKGKYVCRPFKHRNHLYKKFKALLRDIGLEGKPHDLRHTFASYLAMAGVSITNISELLGHSDIRTTMIYAHLSPATHQPAIKKLPFK